MSPIRRSYHLQIRINLPELGDMIVMPDFVFDGPRAHRFIHICLVCLAISIFFFFAPSEQLVPVREDRTSIIGNNTVPVTMNF